MLTGPALGGALRAALKKKGMLPIDAARRYRISKASVSGWFKTGSITSDKLIDLMDLCSDVCGPEHWGLKKWPGGGGHRAAEKPLPYHTLEMAKRILTLPSTQRRVVEQVLVGQEAVSADVTREKKRAAG